MTMKKPTKKKTAATSAATPVQPKAILSSKGKGGRELVNKQPQVQQKAAVAHGMFLHTDDAWSLRYFDPNDLHFKEREVFG
jgi:hypothetical protein